MVTVTASGSDAEVTPCAGVWIEIHMPICIYMELLVTPCAGVWIEISNEGGYVKFDYGHSLCGSVD